MTEHTFISRSQLGLNYTGETPDTETGYHTRREDIPAWMTPAVAQDILNTINECERANLWLEGRALIYIPLSWVPVRERWKYTDAKLFGLALRLNEYTTEPQLAFPARRRKS